MGGRIFIQARSFFSLKSRIFRRNSSAGHNNENNKHLYNSERIALYLPSFRGGGAERVMVTIANNLVCRGYLVDIVLARAEGPYIHDLSTEVRIFDLGASRVTKSIPGLIRYLRTVRPQVLLSAMAHANAAALISRISARVPTRVVISEHNTHPVIKLSRKSVREWMFRYSMRKLYKKAHCVVAVSEGVADSIATTIGYPRELIHVIYNPIVDNAMIEQSYRTPAHPWLASGEMPVVIGIGRLTQQKDFSLLLRAFARLRNQVDARLIILGEGEQRSELESLAENLGLAHVVCLPGFIRNPYSYLRYASVFALSSRWEGLSNVLIEAMACGTAVIATNCPSGPAEVLQHGKFGTLVPVGDVDAMANALYASLQRGKAPEAVFERAKDFGVDQAVTSYLSLLVPGANVL